MSFHPVSRVLGGLIPGWQFAAVAGALLACGFSIYGWHKSVVDHSVRLAVVEAVGERDRHWSKFISDANRIVEDVQESARKDLKLKDDAGAAEVERINAKWKDRLDEISKYREQSALAPDCSRCRIPVERLRPVGGVSGGGSPAAVGKAGVAAGNAGKSQGPTSGESVSAGKAQGIKLFGP